MTKKKTQKDYLQYQIGDLVEWTSHANGYYRTKIGVVVQRVPVGYTPDNYVDQSFWKIEGCGEPRNHESYIIALSHPDKPTEFFWPKVVHLSKSKRYLPIVLEKRKEKKPALFKPKNQ